jgi:transposase
MFGDWRLWRVARRSAAGWARHGAGHTYTFDDTVAWLTVRCSKTAVREMMRVAWRTVGSIITRVSADAMAGTDRFANLSPDRDR